MKKWFYPVSLILLFIILTIAVIPDGYVYGSNTDWLSQHVALAETIRDTCLEQHTLLPSWIRLGGGSNGYQFAYYGFLRPDILIGCLLPQIPMINIIIGYMLAVYLGSVLLMFLWLRTEQISPAVEWLGSILFLTAGCLFHMHRQIMFVNYLPFLLAAFLCIRKKKYRWLPLCLLLVCLSSFYFSISAFAAVGWYWYRTEGRGFWKGSFIKRYIPSAVLSAAMAAALLLPTALVLLEHGRGSTSTGLLKLLELFGPNPVFNNILFNEYGMGLTLICFYPVLAGLSGKSFRRDSLLFLMLGMFGVFSWILNGTLYARPKILIPFMPLVILHCVRFLQTETLRMGALLSAELSLPPVQTGFSAAPGAERKNCFPAWPFAVMIPVSLLWFSQPQFPWILTELGILLALCLILRGLCMMCVEHRGRLSSGRLTPLLHALPSSPGMDSPGMTVRGRRLRAAAGAAAILLLLTAPTGMYLTTAGTENWVKRSETTAGFSREELAEASRRVSFDPLYRFDSLIQPLDSSNKLPAAGLTRNTMYSSVTNPAYSGFCYDTLRTPIRINNRTALLTSDNPFLLRLMGVRYLETTADTIPSGYEPVYQAGENVIAENRNVLPAAYFTSDLISSEDYAQLSPDRKLDAVTRSTVADLKNIPDPGIRFNTSEEIRDYGIPAFSPSLSAGALPEGLTIRKASEGFEIKADHKCQLTATISDPVPDCILLLQFSFTSLTGDTVVIDINGIRNKLSGWLAPYPNQNQCFHYQFTPETGTGTDRLEITFSEGHYVIRDVQWSLYDTARFSEKNYTPLQLTGDGDKNSILSGTVEAESDGVLATSIPLQRGLEILVDRKPSELITVNEAFAGALLTQGTHSIEIRFSPPGKMFGCILSLVSAAGYGIFLICNAVSELRSERRGPMKKKKELAAYLVSGGITTGVNYCLYALLLSFHLPWPAANSAAWAGAVLTAYILNRRLVFCSSGRILREFSAFAALRSATLLAESLLLWLLIDLLQAPAFMSKLLVSAVTVAGNYVLCKYGVFKKGENYHG